MGHFKDLAFFVKEMGNHELVLSRGEGHDLTTCDRMLLADVLKIDQEEVRSK